MPYRQRNTTAEQLEYGHDSNAYELTMYDANQDKPAQQESTSNPAPMPTEPDPTVQDYVNNLYHRLGLTPPSETDASAHDSDSGKQGSKDASETEYSLDNINGKEEISAQVILPDFVEDVGGFQVIRRAWYLCQGQEDESGDSSSDARNDVEETFTLDDVRQFAEINLEAAAIDEGQAQHYETMLETVLGCSIEWADDDENRLKQPQNLAKGLSLIMNYLTKEIY